MFYFSLATLTTTGYGDILPLNPFARSLANLESIIEPFCLAITVARLVTLEPEDRRGQRCVRAEQFLSRPKSALIPVTALGRTFSFQDGGGKVWNREGFRMPARRE